MDTRLVFLLVCLTGCSSRATHSVDAAAPTDHGADPSADLVDDASAEVVDDGTSGPCPVVGYEPCGGSLLGIWHFVSFCPEDLAAAKALFEHPYDDRDACADRTKNPVDGKIVTVGTLRFEETQFSVDTTGHMELKYGFTDDCLAAAVGGEPAEACDSMSRPDKMTCVYDAAATPPCSCEASLPADPSAETVPYERVSDTAISFDGRTATYCVAGDSLILDWTPHPISWRYWVLRRE